MSSKCNLRCRYCHFQDKQESNAKFSLDDLKVITSNIHNYCKKHSLESFKLGIVGAGEPMLYSDEILGMLSYVSACNCQEMKIYTISNATLFSDELLSKFLPYKDRIRICVSLDGYEEIHNTGRMAYSRVMRGIETYRNVFGFMPPINATVNRVSCNNMERLMTFFQEKGFDDVTFSKLVGCDDPELMITDSQYHEFMRFAQASGIKSRQFRLDKKYDCTMYGNLCGVGRTNIFITPEGVYPCGRFYLNSRYRLGDFSSPIDEVAIGMERLSPVEDGKCYYIENIEKQRI